MKLNLKVKKYKSEGDITWEYNPLRNMKDEDDQITEFRVSNDTLNLNLSNPIDIECQPSYDGTVNLIANDDENPPRIINTRFSLLENNRYKIINRNQIKQSNIYNKDTIDRETRLFRNIQKIPKFELNKVSYFGQLQGGNYIFYLKYADDDFNQTDIVAETGIISIFHGSYDNPKTCSGAFMNERTDKSIILTLSNIDTSFTYFNLYFTRSSCDDVGTQITKAYKININYEIDNESKLISIDGFEEIQEISTDELNIQYNIVSSVKSQAQVQNRLFFANVNKPQDKTTDLRNLSLHIIAEESKSLESIGFIDAKNFNSRVGDSITQVEYYSPYNIYYKLGYFPTEIYRFGIVYIFEDDHLSPVYNLRGVDFKNSSEKINFNYNGIEDIPYNDFLETSTQHLSNTHGVFRFSDEEIIDYSEESAGVYPLGIKFSFPAEVIEELHNLGIKGFFFVRQKRIPTLLAQGFSIGVDKISYVPMLNKGTNEEPEYFTESFLTTNKTLSTTYQNRIRTVDKKQSSGLICIDAYVDPQLQSLFNSTDFYLVKKDKFDIANYTPQNYYYARHSEVEKTDYINNCNLLYIPSEVPQKIHNDYGFSTKAGMQEDLRQLQCFGKEVIDDKNAVNYIRGIYGAFIGTTNYLDDNCLYNIYISNYSESFLKEYFIIRMRDRSSFFACTERFQLPEIGNDYDMPITFRGDCFTNTVCQRIQRNFVSSSVPINDQIMEPNCWKQNFKGAVSTDDWDDINKADVDAVPIGHWFAYKCLSNYNLGLRSRDYFNTDETAIMGNPRGFYPIDGISTKSSNKIAESALYNKGYNATVGVRKNFAFERVPYIKDEFDTRIMFSNIQVDGAFRNSYKIFQGLSYEDYDRQYGGITKILPWDNNLLCIFEHAIAIVPINEKALIQTTTSQNIHMYGAGVLQKQLSIISDMYGSSWKDSIIRTADSLYGVDTSAKKIWRLNKQYGFTLISDFTVQRWLNDNLNLKELEKSIILGVRNVKTHYNANKRDVMFTFYNNDNIWNLCYNEIRQGWVTRYSWTPLLSENINNSFFSFDLLRTKIFGIINNNIHKKNNSELTVNESWDGLWKLDTSDLLNIKPIEDLSLILSVDKNNWTDFNINSITIKGYKYNEKNKLTDEVIYAAKASDNYNCEDIYDLDEKVSAVFNNVLIGTDTNLNDSAVQKANYEYYKNNVEGHTHEIVFNKNGWVDSNNGSYLYYTVDLEYTPYLAASYESETESSNSINSLVFGPKKSFTVGLVVEYKSEAKCAEEWKTALLNSIYVHGRAINADEINYFNYREKDKDPNDQILPTKWYDRQEPFEFEFVVNEPKGLHKLFDNLMIVSNNVEPDSLEIEIVGDVYDFNKRKIFVGERFPNESNKEGDDKIETKFEPVEIKYIPQKNEPDPNKKITYKTEVVWDPILEEYSLVVHQDLANIKKYGRRLGNIYYNEDSWYIVTQPIYYKDIVNGEESKLKSTRIRDKWAKIRVKYTGEKIAIITAIQTIMTQSYV